MKDVKYKQEGTSGTGIAWSNDSGLNEPGVYKTWRLPNVSPGKCAFLFWLTLTVFAVERIGENVLSMALWGCPWLLSNSCVKINNLTL